MTDSGEIKYFNRGTGQIETEKVYGDAFVRWMYETKFGNLIEHIACRKPLSVFYGAYQDLGLSKSKVNPFIKEFNIKMDEFLPAEGRNESDPYGTFNEFFTRRFKEGKRNFPVNLSEMGAFSEARYVGYEQVNETLQFPVKGEYLNYNDLIAEPEWNETFKDGPLFIARLCPVDYHRFHFPDSGTVLDTYRVPGKLHSVNPMALKALPQIFIDNEREVSILETDNFGKIAYIEVGATCVGKIKQTYKDEAFNRGQEKGMFLFGGSTVIIIGEKGKWLPSEDILKNTNDGIETYLKLGETLANSK